jgi:hypothetical protein
MIIAYDLFGFFVDESSDGREDMPERTDAAGSNENAGAGAANNRQRMDVEDDMGRVETSKLKLSEQWVRGEDRLEDDK